MKRWGHQGYYRSVTTKVKSGPERSPRSDSSLCCGSGVEADKGAFAIPGGGHQDFTVDGQAGTGGADPWFQFEAPVIHNRYRVFVPPFPAGSCDGGCRAERGGVPVVVPGKGVPQRRGPLRANLQGDYGQIGSHCAPLSPESPAIVTNRNATIIHSLCDESHHFASLPVVFIFQKQLSCHKGLSLSSVPGQITPLCPDSALFTVWDAFEPGSLGGCGESGKDRLNVRKGDT